MADEYLMDIDFSDLDLNQEPSNHPPLHRVERYGSLLNELETAHDRIEERIRQLEVVTARTRQRQQLRQARNSTQLMSQIRNPNFATLVKSSSDRGKGCKRDSSHLVAKALAMGSEVEEGGSFYDCNICLEVAKDPVLTCCGHLFCWSCFYLEESDIDFTSSKDCPVCKGEVSNSTVIPIYGNGDSERVSATESGLMIPPRPKAQRIESVRQQRVTQGLSHVPVTEALRRIRLSIGSVGNQTQEEGESGGGGHRLRIHQVSRVLSESAASLSSLSSALSNAERLVQDLEAVINNRLSVDVGNVFTRPDHQPPVSTADADVALPVSQSTDVDGSIGRVLRTRVSSDVSSSFRSRTLMSRTLDLDGRELRRRRLN